MSGSRVFRAALTLQTFSLTLDGDDQLRDHRKHFGTTFLKHVEGSLDREESVWVLLLADSLAEDGKIMVVVQLLDLNLPCNSLAAGVLDVNGQISSVVEPSELSGGDLSQLSGTGLGLGRSRLVGRFLER